MTKANGLSALLRLDKAGVDRLFEQSSMVKSRLVLLRYRPNGLDYARISPIVSRKTGKANIRNRLKRQIRDIFRCNKSSFCPGADYAVIARYGFAEASFDLIKKDILYCAEKCKKEITDGIHSQDRLASSGKYGNSDS